MPKPILSPEQIAEFHRDGYLIVRSLFDAEETDILRSAAKADAAMKDNAYSVDDGKVGDQTGADPERVENALKIMERVYVELEPGDVLFFHSNTLHASDQNKSRQPRWSFICCYNTRHNNPYKTSHHPCYEKLDK